jgi:TolB protein
MKPFRLLCAVVATVVTVLGGSALFAGLTDNQGSPQPGGGNLAVDIFGSSGGLPMVRKDPIAVPLFINKGPGADQLGLSQKLADQVSEDMKMTGRFEVIDRALYVEGPNAGAAKGQFDFGDWSAISAEYLIKGEFTVDKDSLTTSIRLYHVPTKKMLVGKQYIGKVDDWYVMVHKFGNDVVYELTREKGIFGTKIAFVSAPIYGGDLAEIYVVDVDGRNLKRLTFMGGKAKDPTWSPDGAQLVFAWENTANPQDMQNYLYSVPVEGGTPKLLLSLKGLIVTPRFSPSGSRIALGISLAGNMQVYTVAATGGPPKRLTVSAAIDLFPVWSPSGEEIAFVSDRTGNPLIWKMKSDGSDIKQASFYGSYNQSPDWAHTPTGDKIVYSCRESGQFHILEMNPDGTDTTVITQGQNFGSCEYPNFSPDGRAVVMAIRDDRGRFLRLYNTDGSYTRLLTRIGADDKNPAWSPRLLN